MRQTIKARYHDGVLQPLEPLSLADDAEVQVTVDTDLALGTDEILRRAAQVYQGLSADEITQVESIACLLYTSPSPRDRTRSRMPSSA